MNGSQIFKVLMYALGAIVGVYVFGLIFVSLLIFVTVMIAHDPFTGVIALVGLIVGSLFTIRFILKLVFG